MKYLFVFVLFCALLFSCSDGSDELNDQIIDTWHSQSVMNSENSVICSFTNDELVFKFESNKLSIATNSLPAELCNLYTEKIYSYTIFNYEDDLYLLMDGKEIGQIKIEENEKSYSLTIDETKRSNSVNLKGRVINLLKDK